jgi:hypothetical protein
MDIAGYVDYGGFERNLEKELKRRQNARDAAQVESFLERQAEREGQRDQRIEDNLEMQILGIVHPGDRDRDQYHISRQPERQE